MANKYKIEVKNINSDESDTFETWKTFDKWVGEVLPDEIYEMWSNLEPFERQGYQEYTDWFKDLSISDTKELLHDFGYVLTLVDKPISE